MADLQSQFIAFENTIRVDAKLEKATLAGKRERILNRLSEKIAAQRVAGASIPGYSHRNQGSYAMDTGIKPLDGDYDLDVALIFDFNGVERPDPVTVKGWVYEAVKSHTTKVRWREPCVTVYYVKGGEPQYHVDLAIYAHDASGIFLARGREKTQAEAQSWEPSDPAALVDKIKHKHIDHDHQAQFRRCIRYLKRWKDVTMPSQGNEAPRGIALTACAYRLFEATFDYHPGHDMPRPKPNDLAALRNLVSAVIGKFDGRGKLEVTLPVAPHNDLFGMMSDRQLEVFKARLEALRDALDQANRDPDPHTAAATLAKLFGADFPVPPKPSTARKQGPGYSSSGNSG